MYVSRVPSGKWKATYRDAAGRRHSRSFERKRDADGWAADREAEVRRGRHVDPRQSRQPVAVLVERWWSGRVVEATTAATDRGRLDNHVLPHWGGWPVEAVTHSSVQAWVKKMSHVGVGAWTVRSSFNLLSSVMESARRDGLVPDNACRGVSLPPKPPGRELYLTQPEVDRVAEAMARRPDAAAFDQLVLFTAAYCGLRWGELSGLTVPRLDLLRKRLHVVEVVIEVDGRFARKSWPKGRRRRTVPVPDWLVLLLAEHLRIHPAVEDDLGALVFRPRVLGYRLGRSRALSRHHWPRVAYRPAVHAAFGCTGESHPCRGVDVHDLRHSYASWLVQGGRTITEVAALIGDTVSTAERYAHLGHGFHEGAVAALGRAVK